MAISAVQAAYSAITQSRSKLSSSDGDFSTITAGLSSTPQDTANNGYGAAKISGEAQSVLLNQHEVLAPDVSARTYTMNSSKGYIDMDLEAYFSPRHGIQGNLNLDDIPLLLPSPDNIAAIKEYASSTFQNALKEYGITAPSSISYDNEGNMILPQDYAYKEKLEQLLEKTPHLDRALRTANALTSHYVELQKLAPYHEEAQAAQSQQELDAVIRKYSHLFYGNRRNSDIALHFTEKGLLSLYADGKAV